MIIVNAHTQQDHIVRIFKYMANVWFEYDDRAFESQKNRWGPHNAYKNHPSELWNYIDYIQSEVGAQLVVLFISREIDIPQKVYDKADLVIQHHSGSGTYRVLEDRLGDYTSNQLYSAGVLSNILHKYQWGERDGD